MTALKFRVVLYRIRLFPTLISKIALVRTSLKKLNGHHKCYSEMADIRQFIRSELSIIKKEVIESTRSMIRNEIRSISFDSNL